MTINADTPLTADQHRALYLICQGRTHAEAAAELGTNRTAISDRLRAATRKMGCANSTEAAAHYAQWLLIRALLKGEQIRPGAVPALERRARMLVPTEVLPGVEL